MFRRSRITSIRHLYTVPKRTKLRRSIWIIPSGLLAITAVGVTYWINKSNKEKKPTELQPNYFISYHITRKLTNDSNHFIIELTPVVAQKVNIWSELTNRNLWSVEVKQPEIMVVRNYTPLPLQFVSENTYDLEQINQNETGRINNNGKLLLFIKNYDQGEVSKWIANLPLNHTIEIRGPFVEYSIPKQVNNVNFFAAGTAIVSPLQLLLNPYSNGTSKPKLNIFYSCGDIKKELGNINNILSNYLRQNSSMVNMKLFEDSKNENIAKNMKKFASLIPTPSNSAENTSHSLICGPDSYIETIAGKRYDLSQGPVKGLLGEKGWSSKNIYKLS